MATKNQQATARFCRFMGGQNARFVPFFYCPMRSVEAYSTVFTVYAFLWTYGMLRFQQINLSALDVNIVCDRTVIEKKNSTIGSDALQILKPVFVKIYCSTCSVSILNESH